MNVDYVEILGSPNDAIYLSILDEKLERERLYSHHRKNDTRQQLLAIRDWNQRTIRHHGYKYQRLQVI